jgi:hypothetical protein
MVSPLSQSARGKRRLKNSSVRFENFFTPSTKSLFSKSALVLSAQEMQHISCSKLQDRGITIKLFQKMELKL